MHFSSVEWILFSCEGKIQVFKSLNVNWCVFFPRLKWIKGVSSSYDGLKLAALLRREWFILYFVIVLGTLNAFIKKLR